MNIRPETVKLGENTGGKLVDVSLGHDFFKKSNTQNKSNKRKKKSKNLKKHHHIIPKKLLYSKRSHKQNEKET